MPKPRVFLMTMFAGLAPASLAAGVLLLGIGLWADLADHEHGDASLLAQLPPQYAAIVREHQEREATNPWHRTLVLGEGLLIAGLGALYLGERSRRSGQSMGNGQAGTRRSASSV